MNTHHDSAFTVALVNTKGGVGKTTLCANIAAICADLGQRVLIIDADPLGSISKYFKLSREAPTGLSSVLRRRTIDAAVISNTTIANLDIITHDGEMPGALIELSAQFQCAFALEQAISSLKRNDFYDLVFIDTPGAPGLLQDLGIVPADLLVAPILPETLSVSEVGPLLNLLRRYELGAPNSRMSAVPCKAVINRATPTTSARQITSELRSQFLVSRGRFTLVNTIINQAVVFPNASRLRDAVHRIEPGPNDQIGPASTALHALVAELLPHLYDRLNPESTESQS